MDNQWTELDDRAHCLVKYHFRRRFAPKIAEIGSLMAGFLKEIDTCRTLWYDLGSTCTCCILFNAFVITVDIVLLKENDTAFDSVSFLSENKS